MAPRGTGDKGDGGFVPTAYKRLPTDYPLQTYGDFLVTKRTDDKIGPYWRIHNKLYDLNDFIAHHPGGKMWLEVTKGTDITEAFESAHISEKAELLLKKFYVKDISTPRNSPYTFHDDGFYKTLKRKIRPILKKMGKEQLWKSVLIQDSLALAFVLLTLASSILGSYLLAILAGFALCLTVNCSHNYFHQRNNWRMYYFDLSFSSSYHWRVTHALSHHLYTNTVYDMEISSLEPYWMLLPKSDKTFMQRYGSSVYELLLIPAVPCILYTRKMIDFVSGRDRFRPEYILPVIEFIVMWAIAPSFWLAVKLYMTIHTAFNYFFVLVGVTVAHHHPDIFHDGDKMREDADWGLCQLDAVRDRHEVTGNLFLVLTTFGDHTLHHLFPTVDHANLNSLYPALMETCKEFNVPFSFMSWQSLFVGKYLQLANITPNKSPPGYKQKKN